MDIAAIGEVIGLANTAVGATGKAADTIKSIRGLFEGGKAPDTGEATRLLNSLAGDLTAANMMNVQLSVALKSLSEEMLQQDEFENQKEKYELYQTTQGAVVFKLKDALADSQPMHFICPVCLNRDKIISYISGNDDYRQCQSDTNHMFQFSDTPIQSHEGGSYFV
ncbi:hypothetical protein HGG67_06180 [Rhodobacteraceae bacterium R_SAG8]|nr:hypothetical protein [Rhodobacteraceae bacterium R_SAG8]